MIESNMPGVYSSVTANSTPSNSLKQEISNLINGVDKYSTNITRDINGNASKVEIKDGNILINSAQINRDSNGNVLNIVEAINNFNITTTINRDSDGNVTSVTKDVK